MRLLLTLGSLALAPPLAAQAHPLPAPHPSTVLRLTTAAASYPQDTVRATTRAGTGTPTPLRDSTRFVGDVRLAD